MVPIDKAMLDETSKAALFDKLKWMNSKEAAFYLRMSTAQLRNLVWQGHVRCYRLRGRLRFLRGDLDLLMKPAF